MTGLGDLWLSEFAGSKDRHQIEDDGGDRSDWIEIYNRGSDTVALGGHFLTDTLDDLDQWKFPDIQLEPDGYLLIFASGKDRRTGTLHANFKLSSEGEFIALVRPDGKTIVHSVSPPFPTKPTTKSFGLGHSKNTVVAFDKATPGKPNANPSLPEPTFSEKRGFYDDAFELRITSDKQIRYTLDGASPSEHAGLIYHEPIPIKATTILRAAAFDPLGAQTPSNTVTHTYIFPGDTIKQRSVPPSGWPDPQPNPQSKKAQAYAYGMLPSAEIEATDDELRRAMRAIPSISLVTDLAHWFDPNSGIYCNGQGRGREWERPVSAELVDPQGDEPGFQIDAGIRIRGGGSRRGSNPKHAFRLYFRQSYGAAKLRYPLFQDEGVAEFDDIDLRTAQNNSWSFKVNDRYTFLRDVFVRDCQRDMGQPYTRSRYCHLFLNGLYWGLYQTQEHSEASYAANYFGGSKDDYDVIKAAGFSGRSQIEATDGDLDRWQQIWEIVNAIAASDDPSDQERLYQDLQKEPRLLNIGNLIDYMILNIYAGNADGPIPGWNTKLTRNWFAIGDRLGKRGFQFFQHDSEVSMEKRWFDNSGPYPAGSKFEFSNPQWFHQQLLASASYRARVAAQAENLLFNRGPLSPQASAARVQRRINELQDAVVCEAARWGRSGPPYMKKDWETAVKALQDMIRRRAGGTSQFLLKAKRYAHGNPDNDMIEVPLFNPIMGVGQMPQGGCYSANQVIKLKLNG